MANVGSKAALTPARKRLVELMQKIGFGRIEGLVIRRGEPVFDPPPIVVHDIKFDGENRSRPPVEVDDFVLKKQVIHLFAALDRVRNGTVEKLEVKDGLPFLMSKSDRS
jgi:hypothetical protein